MSDLQRSNSINNVAYKLLSKCRELKKDENIIISPLSISLGILSLAFGAKGNSRSEIGSLLLQLQVTSDPVSDEDLQALSLTFRDLGEGVKLVNGLFLDKTFPVSESYRRNLEKSQLPLETKSVNFREQSQAAVEEINKWVEIATESKIKNFLSNDAIDETTKLALVNAIHFKGKWLVPFIERRTAKKPFFVTPTEEITVDMMVIEEDFNSVKCPKLDCRCIELPYMGASSISCYILLPNKIDGLKKIDENLTPEIFKKVLEEMKNDRTKRKILLNLPRFKIECEVDLEAVLTELGVKEVFQRGIANLSGFSEGVNDLFVSSAIHKAVIEVNEKGTEASAATDMRVQLCCYIKPQEFFVNRPFALVILNNESNTVLFMGSIKKIPV